MLRTYDCNESKLRKFDHWYIRVLHKFLLYEETKLIYTCKRGDCGKIVLQKLMDT